MKTTIERAVDDLIEAAFAEGNTLTYRSKDRAAHKDAKTRAKQQRDHLLSLLTPPPAPSEAAPTFDDLVKRLGDLGFTMYSQDNERRWLYAGHPQEGTMLSIQGSHVFGSGHFGSSTWVAFDQIRAYAAALARGDDGGGA